MSTCAACAGKGRPIGSILLTVPVFVAGLAATWVALTKGRAISTPVALAITVVFALFLAALVRFSLRLAQGNTCAGCGRDLPR